MMMTRVGDSEECELIVGDSGCAAGAPSFEEVVSGDEQVEVTGVALDAFGKPGGGEHLIERVTDVL